MANDFYTVSGTPGTGAQGSSSAMRSEFALIAAAFDLLPDMTGNGGEIIAVNSGATALEAITTTGTGSGVRATSPTFTTPILGTPTSGTLTNCTGFPAASLAGLGSGVATWLATPSSANLASAVTDETGSGALVFGTSPTLVAPVLGAATATSLAASIGTDALAGSFSNSKNDGGSATVVLIQDDRGFNGVNSGKSLHVRAWRSGGNDTGDIFYAGGYDGGDLPAFRVGIDGTARFYGALTLDSTVNKVTVTAPASGSTLTIADGKTLTASNTLTFTGTDSSSVAFGTGGTVTYTTSNLSAFAATTSAELAGVISDETGSGALVFGTSPTLTTPVLGVATATSVNKMAITAPATSSTLAVADGKTFTASNTLTLTGTDGTSLNINAVATLNSSAFTPTITGVANVDSSAAPLGQWLRVGNIVHVTGAVSINCTSSATFTTFDIDLPIASDLATTGQCAGAAGVNFGTTVTAGAVAANTTDNRARVAFTSSSTGSENVYFSFSYVIV